jgi:hypothetical protein
MTPTVTKIETDRDQIDQAIGRFRSKDYISAITLACTARNSPMTAAEGVRAKYSPAMATEDIIDHVVQDHWWREETPAMVWFKETHLQRKR